MTSLQTQPWQAEKTLSLTQAKNLILEQFPELQSLQIEWLGEGWDNLVFRVNQSLMFRFPRRKIALDFLQYEWSALSFLQDKLPVQIPRPRFQAQATQAFDWPFMAYDLVPGVTACCASLSGAERMNLAAPLARTLKCLHGLSLEELHNVVLPGDSLRRMDVTYRKPWLRERLKIIEEKHLLSAEKCSKIERFLQCIPDKIPVDRSVTLCHGDLYARHLMVDAQKKLVGLIDWGDVHRGDPAVDLSLVYSFLPPEAHTLFWRVYGQVSEESAMLAKFRAFCHNLSLLLYSKDIQDHDLWREAHQALDWLIKPDNPY